MKQSVRFIVSFLIVVNVGYNYGQSLGQDREGFSTVVFPSFNISLDATNDVATFSIYQEIRKKGLPKSRKDEDSVFAACSYDILNIDRIRNDLKSIYKDNEEIYDRDKLSRSYMLGLDIKGSSKNGIAPIFSDDRLASAASIQGFVAYSKRWLRYKNRFLKEGDTSLNGYIRKVIEGDKQLKLKQEISKEVKRLKGLGYLLDSDITNLLRFEDSTTIQLSINRLKSRIKTFSDAGLAKVISEINKDIFLINWLNDTDENLKKKNEELLIEIDDTKHEGIKEEITKLEKTLRTVFSIQDLKREEIRNKKRSLFDSIRIKIDEIPIEGVKKAIQPLFTLNIESAKKEWQTFQKQLFHYQNHNNFISSKSPEEFDFYDVIIQKYNELISEYSKEKKEKKKKKKDNGFPEKFISEGIIYLRGGPTGNRFRLDLENDSTLVDDRFPEIDFQSYRIELGGTYFFKERNYFGVSLALSYTDNFSALDESTFTLQKVDTTISDGTFASSEQVKAFSGPYDRFMRYDINLDYVRLFTLKEKPQDDTYSHLYLSLNPYLRHRIYEDADILKNNTVLGLGAHAFNSKDNKLMGGAFIQTEDLFGVHKDDEDVLQKGITFGLIVKYNFDGLKLPKAK